MIKAADRNEESYEVQDEQFDWSEEQLMQAVKSVDDEERSSEARKSKYKSKSVQINYPNYVPEE